MNDYDNLVSDRSLRGNSRGTFFNENSTIQKGDISNQLLDKIKN